MIRLLLPRGTVFAGEHEGAYRLDGRSLVGLIADLDREQARKLRDSLDEFLAEPGGQLPLDADPPPPDEPQQVVPIRPEQPIVGPSPATSRTSRKAALANFPRSGTQRWRILREAEAAGGRGVTRDELVVALSMPPNVVCPRVLELLEGEFLVPGTLPVPRGIGRRPFRRKTRTGEDAEVLVLTRKAQADLRAERDRMGRGA